MTYKLVFKVEAEKEWRKLDSTIRSQFKKKLIERLENPHVPTAKLSSMQNCYKIKLRSAGYRLVYQVRDLEVVISVVAVGKRERNQVYKIAAKRV
ncbi:type II toxin-antitoxin system RelE family toxin [Vibrio parahaemolyticus]|uniref:type II toxin-antitoxin system RelE family toxin n=1 Tax=Vibrio parahaemolyticus TaxID=670 RepID=UPI00111D87E6|nr:type II toxin-antitoxin system RelE/ParE family toxin [Vibrio parahaemolyticus]TOK03149.1 type II toxin-antitoxin system mRNA interferase toxin, RelE/StbE family [Vibrio parahaemolyticus]